MSPMTFFERARQASSSVQPKAWTVQATTTSPPKTRALDPTAEPWNDKTLNSDKENVQPHPQSLFGLADPANHFRDTPTTKDVFIQRNNSVEPEDKALPSPSLSPCAKDYVPPHLRGASTSITASSSLTNPFQTKTRDLSPGKRASSSNSGEDEPKRVKFADQNCFNANSTSLHHHSSDSDRSVGTVQATEDTVVTVPQESEIATFVSTEDDANLDKPVGARNDVETTSNELMVIDASDRTSGFSVATQSLLDELTLHQPVTTGFNLVVPRDEPLVKLVGRLANEICALRTRVRVLEMEKPQLLAASDESDDGAVAGVDQHTPEVLAPVTPSAPIKKEEYESSEAGSFGVFSLTVNMGSGSRAVVRVTDDMKVVHVIKAAFEQLNMSPRFCSLSHDGKMLPVKWSVADADLMDGDELDLEF
ncbi:hypothetical protein K461DRAFT_318689 [Myriangium duriaei CBS 260.36]|uniref:Uncharacterized protein n=1 Tax=Myriangium duriaei CBS 260.36 TaxID=1168546 RepID=A0A9P4J7C0_9PEZI|nr:hypothetical protein K461DRAFT_318689 [Myriangium duriaei CBS 260.36]